MVQAAFIGEVWMDWSYHRGRVQSGRNCFSVGRKKTVDSGKQEVIVISSLSRLLQFSSNLLYWAHLLYADIYGILHGCHWSEEAEMSYKDTKAWGFLSWKQNVKGKNSWWIHVYSESCIVFSHSKKCHGLCVLTICQKEVNYIWTIPISDLIKDYAV